MKSTHFYIIILVIIIIIQSILAFQVETQLEGRFEGAKQLKVSIGNFNSALNVPTIIWTWVIILILSLLSWLCTRKLKQIPERFQASIEIFVELFDNLTKDTLGANRYRPYVAFIGTLFIFICFCNWIGIFPPLWHLIDIKGIDIIPHWLEIVESTRDLNTTLALGLVSALVVHFSMVRFRGFKGYIKYYFQPIPFLMPLNLIGEIAKVVSHSFRLFGNIMGGAVIILVVSELTHHWFIPILLNGFFGLFVGSVQAFVFAMLAVTYLAVGIGSED